MLDRPRYDSSIIIHKVIIGVLRKWRSFLFPNEQRLDITHAEEEQLPPQAPSPPPKAPSPYKDLWGSSSNIQFSADWIDSETAVPY